MPVVFNAPVRMEIREPVAPLPFNPFAPEDSRPPRVVLDPILSQDGNTLVFEATGDLWIQDSEAGPARPLLEGPGLEWLASFSWDGRRVAFVQELHGQQSLKVLDRATGEDVTLLSGGRYVYPAWSPDGKRVIYTAPHGVEAVNLTDGGTEKLTDVPMARPHFSADGQYLYGTAGDAVYRLLLEGHGQPEPITRLAGSVSEAIVSPRWMAVRVRSCPSI
jgi:Tol biopolymer transport system component